jgi:FMN phosphatase YigB (HAD superfamily)
MVQEMTGAKECLFIDDTQENIQGALDCGWRVHRTVDDTHATLEWLKSQF